MAAPWLEFVHEGYGRFAGAFDEYGVENKDDLRALDADDKATIFESLTALGAKSLNLKKISQALGSLSVADPPSAAAAGGGAPPPPLETKRRIDALPAAFPNVSISFAINSGDWNSSIARYRMAAKTWVSGFEDERVIVFSSLLQGTIPGTAKRIVPCCDGEDYGGDIARAQKKREYTWGKMLWLLPHSDWYVSTEEDTWWNVTALRQMLWHLNTSDPRMTGSGPGHSINGPFAIVNRAMLELFANATLLAGCRAELLRKGNPYKDFAFKGAEYNNDHLISFCAGIYFPREVPRRLVNTRAPCARRPVSPPKNGPHLSRVSPPRRAAPRRAGRLPVRPAHRRLLQHHHGGRLVLPPERQEPQRPDRKHSACEIVHLQGHHEATKQGHLEASFPIISFHHADPDDMLHLDLVTRERERNYTRATGMPAHTYRLPNTRPNYYPDCRMKDWGFFMDHSLHNLSQDGNFETLNCSHISDPKAQERHICRGCVRCKGRWL
jgi:hypothetical protein